MGRNSSDLAPPLSGTKNPTTSAPTKQEPAKINSHTWTPNSSATHSKNLTNRNDRIHERHRQTLLLTFRIWNIHFYICYILQGISAMIQSTYQNHSPFLASFPSEWPLVTVECHKQPKTIAQKNSQWKSRKRVQHYIPICTQGHSTRGTKGRLQCRRMMQLAKAFSPIDG